MAIFGDLADMPTPEVLRMLGSRTGKLHVRPDPNKQFELHLQDGTISCFKEDGFSVRDPAALRRGVTSLLKLQRGGFEFNQLPATDLEHHVDLGRQTVLELSAALGSDGPADAADDTNSSLDPKTRFKLKEGSEDFAVPDNLRVFLRRAHAQLSEGCSAEELAVLLELHPSVVKLYLLRLRTLDKVTPVRAYASNYKGYSAAPPAAPTIMTTTTTTTTTTVATTAIHTPVPDFGYGDAATPARPAPQKSLIRRLLSAFSFGGR